jgi:hypothetical protein
MWYATSHPRPGPTAGGAEEELIVDERARLTPAEMVELRLASLLDGHGLVLSQKTATRRSSRDHGQEVRTALGGPNPAPVPTPAAGEKQGT